MVCYAQDGGGKVYCQVIVDIAHERVDHAFTYTVPPTMQIMPGQRVIVPFGGRSREGIVLSLSEETDYDVSRIRPVTRVMEDYAAVPEELIRLAREMAESAHCPLAETLRLMMPAQMRGERVRVKTEKTAAPAVTPEQLLEAAASEKRRPKRAAILRLLAEQGEMPVPAIQDAVPNPRDALLKLEADGLITLEEREVFRHPGEAFRAGAETPPALTSAQQEALDEIIPGLKAGRGRFLLHGVTGSGKTEVFMAAVKKTLEMDRSAIILVPEIALTPQMVSWFRSRFGPVSAVIHSRLSAGERFDEWRRIRKGEARVVIGARSAVFSPVRKLGLIVVDEEHETTYLSDRHPRYDARDVAASRCAHEGAALILASATPSIASFARARRGDYMLLEMPERVNGIPMPQVDVVDMRDELESGNRTVLSRPLREALQACIREGNQAMLLMNRRGYHSFVSCRSCGYVVKCPNCDVSLTYHLGRENDGELRCHYCGYAAKQPETCPACGSRYIRYFGSGTQKVEDEVRKLLPNVATVRMDLDTTAGKDGHGKLLEEFRSGRARVLIGTQMIAKGLDFPKVTLVGIVAADLTLNLPDYRSRERTFQLLTQAAGRAGRGADPGRVIIQTYKPNDPVILHAAGQDYRAFFEEEFRRRKIALYPPFTQLVRVLAESGSEADAAAEADLAEQAVTRMLAEHPAWKKQVLMMVNDVPSVSILRGKYRRHLLMKVMTGSIPDELLAAVSDYVRNRETVRTDLWFEINPTTMM